MLTWKRLVCAGARLSKSNERLRERELPRLGMACYYSARDSIIKKTVYRGTWLKDHLTSQGYELIDVYRYASKVRLFGRLPPKTTTEGSCTLQQRLHGVIPPIPHPKEQLLSHDVLDATLAAQTAFRPNLDLTLTLS